MGLLSICNLCSWNKPRLSLHFANVETFKIYFANQTKVMQAPVKKLDAGTGAPINLQKLTSHSRAGTGILEQASTCKAPVKH